VRYSSPPRRLACADGLCVITVALDEANVAVELQLVALLEALARVTHGVTVTVVSAIGIDVSVAAVQKAGK
jgi:hypothetical protein